MSDQTFYIVVVILFTIVVVALGMIYNVISDSNSSKFREFEECRHETEIKNIENGKA